MPDLKEFVRHLYEKYRHLNEGSLASYIPELTKANPNWFAIWEWAYKVGIPAKSGVSRGIIAVIPDRAGIAVYSPLIDHRGNSVRGIKVFEDLTEEFQLHLLDFPLEQCPFLDIFRNRDSWDS